MKTKDEKKVVPSFDELVFENRNKEYGAFQIRKMYNSALTWSVLVSVFFLSASVVTPFVLVKNEPIKPVQPVDSIVYEVDSTIINMKFPDPNPPAPDLVKVKVLDYSKINVVDTLPPEEKNSFLTAEELGRAVKDGEAIEKPEEIKVEVVTGVDDNKINEVFKVNEKPFFGIGGDNEFRTWIAQHIVYPQSAIDMGLQGRVYLQFVVEKDGSISNIKVVKSIDPELSKEAIRVLELSPKWNPGKIDGDPVRVLMNFPITFTLTNN